MNNRLSVIKNVVYGVKFDKEKNQQVELTVPVNEQHVLLNEPAFKRPDDYLHNIILAEILKSYLHLSWAKPLDDDLSVMVEEIKLSIQNKYKQIRAEELPIIFADGIRKVYGDYMGLSIVSFEMFVIGYLESRKRKDLALSLPQPEIKKEPTLQERFEIASKNAMDAFLAYQVGKDISLQAPTVYRFLRGIKLFEYTEAEQDEFWSQAEQEIHRELRLKKTVTIEKFKREEIEKQLNGELSIDEKIKAQAQRLGLYSFFQSLMIDETDLQELINNNKPF